MRDPDSRFVVRGQQLAAQPGRRGGSQVPAVARVVPVVPVVHDELAAHRAEAPCGHQGLGAPGRVVVLEGPGVPHQGGGVVLVPVLGGEAHPGFLVAEAKERGEALTLVIVAVVPPEEEGRPGGL
jgi:hypothetical protein